MTSEATVGSVTAQAYRIPTDLPESDGTLSWDATTIVVVRIAGGGAVGCGYTYADEACVPLIDRVLAAEVVGRAIDDVPAAWRAMVHAIRNLGRPGLVSCAISAVDTALWDLKARVTQVPLASLLGCVRSRVPVYGSGGFITYDDATAQRQLETWTQEWGIDQVKIKIGEDHGNNVPRDLARVTFARGVIGDIVDLFVDANGGYRRKQAIRVGAFLADVGVVWFEEPVTSDDLDGLRQVREAVSPDVTAGEYGYDLAYFAHMVQAQAVDCLQVDVTRCGGITEWQRVCALAAAVGLDVSAHCAPALHLAIAAATINFRHLEYFHDHARLEERLFDGVVRPEEGQLAVNVESPGSGWEFKESDARPYRVA